MSIFSFKKNKSSTLSDGSYSLVIGLSSGSISGGIIKHTEKAGVDVVYYAKEDIPFQQDISIPRHLELMEKTLTTLASKIQTEGLTVLKSTNPKLKNLILNRAFYLLSSPWCISETKTIKVKENMVFKVTDAYINKTIDQAEKEYQNSNFKNSKVIEKKIIQIKNNGYVVDNIINQHTKEFELSVHFSFADNQILDSIEKSISNFFHIDNVWCHSSSLAIFSTIRNLFAQKDDFIHLDISEEMTDISVVSNDIITNLVSIPMGRNYFIRELSKDLNIPESVASTTIKMHFIKSGDDLANIKNTVSLNKITDTWLAKITDTLNDLRTKKYISQDVFLIANSDLSFFLKGKLEQNDYQVLFIENKNIKSNLKIEDVIFKLGLMFLDNIYKI
jgi:hypothetical protein